MTVIINGSSGITDVDGTAAAPALTGTDTDTGIFFPAANTIAFSTAGTEDMRIDSSGNVGIGATPSTKLDVNGPSGNTSFTGTNAMAITVRGSTSSTDYSAIDFRSSAANSGSTAIGRIGVVAGGAGSSMSFGTSNSYASGITNTAMTIDPSGNLLVGQTSGGNFCLELGNGLTSGVSAARLYGANLGTLSCGKSGGNYPWVGYNLRFTNTTDSYLYHVGDTASAINFKSGGVYTQTAPSGTAGNAISFTSGPYITQGAANWTAGSSDVRVKKNFEPSQGLAEVLQIEPIKYHFNWDSDSSPKRLGFKAQNLQPLIPEMVVEKDELAEDGTPLLTITPDFILPVLVKAIQELKAELDATKAEIAALKG